MTPTKAETLRSALESLVRTANLLQQNSEGCAVNHHGFDFEQQGLPGWLRDTKASIDAAWAALASPSIEGQETEADKLVGEVEARFPNWRSYRDLIDCIDCTLHALRGTSSAIEGQAGGGDECNPATGEMANQETDATYFKPATAGRNELLAKCDIAACTEDPMFFNIFDMQERWQIIGAVLDTAASTRR